jgi:hypothetical protein
MNIDDFELFIKISGLSAEEWDQIFDLAAIEQQINQSKKIGTSRHLKSISPLQKSFLIEMNKNAQKIIYRSVKRIVSKVLEGDAIEFYMDSQCHTELHQLDLTY